MALSVKTTAGSKVTGEFDIESLILELHQVGNRAMKGVSGVMKDGAKDIENLARSYAPYDEGYLEDAIKSDSLVGDDRRTVAVVYVDGQMPGSGGPGEGRLVGDYALRVHEGQTPGGTGEVNRGKGTQAKGPKAGGKFLERAYRDTRKAILTKVQAIAQKLVRNR